MRRYFVLNVIVILAGCASGGGGGSASTTTAAATSVKRGGPDLITSEEITQSGKSYSTAYELVESLRPTMMRSRAGTMTYNTPSGTSTNDAAAINVIAFVDDVRLGGVEAMRQVPASQVKEIRYINGRDATTKWGTGYTSGVIQIISKK